MLKFIQTEIVMIQSLVQVTIALVCAFGVHLTTEQTAAIMGFSAVVLALIARQNVTPVANAPKPA